MPNDKLANTQKPPNASKSPPFPTTRGKRKRNSGKNRPSIGGSAVTGAKSTLPKAVSTTNDPKQQEAESYNRDMRRRMQHLGTGSQDEKAQSVQERRKKRLAHKKHELDERRERLRRSLPAGKPTLGRKNTYFLIGVIIFVILLIVVFFVLRQLHMLG